jgi:hypothetical protein
MTRRFWMCALISLVVLFGALPVLSINRSVHAQTTDNADGVITTNLPKPGGTQGGPLFRLVPPTYGDYSNMETDPVAITAAERDAALAKFHEEFQTPVSVLNAWADVKEGAPAIQVVNNVPISGALYTLVLPVGWTKSAKLPVMLSGNGAASSNNQTLWKDGRTQLLAWVARSTENGRSGLIAAYSNCGGQESLGADEHTYRSVGAFFDFVAQNGGDPMRAIMVGASRGGGTALMWGANPLKLNYNAVAVFADIPPVDFAYISQRSVQTYPTLGWIYALLAHDPNGWRYESGNGPGQKVAPFLYALFGVEDLAAVRAHSPIGMAELLKGKQVVIARGAHDAFFSLAEFLAFDRRLNEVGVPHMTIITYGQGHSASLPLYDQVAAYVAAITQGKDYQVPVGRFLYINQAPPEGSSIPLDAFVKGQPDLPATPATSLPFSAEFPEKAGVGLPMDVSVCGAPGASFTAQAKDPAGKVAFDQKGTLDASECATYQVAAPSTPNEYTWEFTYNGKAIPSTNTPLRNEGGCGLPAVMLVTKEQPAPADLAEDGSPLSFGLDEFSVQEAGCLTP